MWDSLPCCIGLLYIGLEKSNECSVLALLVFKIRVWFLTLALLRYFFQLQFHTLTQ